MKEQDKRPSDVREGTEMAISRRGFIFKTGFLATAGGAALGGLSGCGKATAQGGAAGQSGAQSVTSWNHTVQGPFTSGVPVGIQQQAGNFAFVRDLEVKVKATSERMTLRFNYLGTPDPSVQVNISAVLLDSGGATLTTVSMTTTDARLAVPDPALELSGMELTLPDHNIETFRLDSGLVDQLATVTLTLGVV